MRLIDADALLEQCRGAQELAKDGQEFANSFYSPSRDISTEWWCVEDLIENAPTIDLAKVVIDELEEAYDDLYEAKTEYESGLRDGIYAAMIRVEELPFWEGDRSC